MLFPLEAVFFDIDGVLIDSLPAHLKICHDKAIEFGLKLKIPTVQEFREMVRQGVKVSPMRYFFLAVGFPEYLADLAVVDYQNEFMERYRPKPFPNTEKLLSRLRKASLKIGLVTSNTRANVEPALGHAMEYFEKRCLFYFDRYPEPMACTRFRRHRVRCFDGAGVVSWRDGSLLESSSLRRCG